MSGSFLSAVRLSLRWRFYLGFGAVVATLLALLSGAVLSLDTVGERFRTLVNGPVEEMLVTKDLRARILGLGFVVHHYVSDEDPLYTQQYRQRVQEVELALERLLGRSDLTPAQVDLLREAQRQWGVFKGMVRELHEQRGALDHARLSERLDDLAAYLTRIAHTLDRVTDESVERLHAEVQWSAELRQKAVAVLASLFVGGLVLALTTGAGLLRTVVAPLRELEDCVDCLGGGRLPAPRGGVGDLQEVSGRIQRVARVLEQESAHDPLTGLYSFRAFHEAAEREIHRANRYNRPFALVLVDIDDFRHVNETFGYLAGDSVICSVAARIQSHVRPTDVAARYGGEEIALLLAETDEEGALETAERIRRTVSETPLNMGEARTLRVTVSVGVALFPDDAEDLASLLQAAGEALRAAQASGKNRVCSWSELSHFG